MTDLRTILDRLDEPAPLDSDEWSLWVSRRSEAVPHLTAALRAAIDLADNLDLYAADQKAQWRDLGDLESRGRHSAYYSTATRLRSSITLALSGLT